MHSVQRSTPGSASTADSPYFETVTAPESPYFYPQCPCEKHMDSTEIYLGDPKLAIAINQVMVKMLERMYTPLQTAGSEKQTKEVSKELHNQTPPPDTGIDITASRADESQTDRALNDISFNSVALFNCFEDAGNIRTPLRNITNSMNIPAPWGNKNHADEVDGKNTKLPDQLFLDVDIKDPLFRTEGSEKENQWEKYQGKTKLLTSRTELIENQSPQKNRQG